MNIITVPYSSKYFYSRPDTSLNRDSNDYFCPDGTGELAAAVFVYVRAAKAGKCVSARFAGRYYSTTGTGVQLFAPSIAKEGNPESWWVSRSLDNSTFLLGDEGPADTLSPEMREKIDNAIEKISGHISFRTGDYIAIEIAPAEIIPENVDVYRVNGAEIKIIR